MRRTPEQALGEWGEELVIAEFMQNGWLAERCQRDYGVDIVVQPSDGYRLSGQIALIQVKARTAREIRDGSHRLPVTVEHAEYWHGIPLPVYLAVVYAVPEQIYLINIHNVVAKASKLDPDWANRRTLTVEFPELARFDEGRLRHVRAEIAERYQILVDAIATSWKYRGAGFFTGPPKEQRDAEALIRRWASETARALSTSAILAKQLEEVLHLEYADYHADFLRKWKHTEADGHF